MKLYPIVQTSLCLFLLIIGTLLAPGAAGCTLLASSTGGSFRLCFVCFQGSSLKINPFLLPLSTCIVVNRFQPLETEPGADHV